jgi:hypothetical protein
MVVVGISETGFLSQQGTCDGLNRGYLIVTRVAYRDTNGLSGTPTTQVGTNDIPGTPLRVHPRR